MRTRSPLASAAGDDFGRNLRIGIDDGRIARREQRTEQAQLGREIMIQRRMVIEVIARQVGEGAGHQPDMIEPMLGEAMRRGFQRHMGDPGLGQRSQRLMQGDRVGRRQGAVDFTIGGDDPQGPERGGLAALRLPDLAHEGGHGGLAAGAGHGHDGAGLPSGMAGCSLGESRPDLRHDREADRDGQVGGRAFGHDGGGSIGQRLGDEAQSIGAGARHGEKRETRAHGAAIGRESQDRAVAMFGRDMGARQQFGQGHRKMLSMPMPSLATKGNGWTGRFRFGGRFRMGATRSMILPQTSPEFQAAVWNP